MQPAASKKHKRSGSVIVHPAPVPFKAKIKNAGHGRFQGPSRLKKEKKNFDTTAVIATFGTLAAPVAVTLINGINVGSTANAAIGRQVRMRSVHVRLQANAVVGATSCATCRLLCVYDKQPNGALGTLASIFTAVADNTCASMNLGYSDRYSVLFDEKFTIGKTGTDNDAYLVDRYVKVNLVSKAITNAFTGAIGGIQEGAIYLIPISDNALLSGAPAVTYCMTRIRFYDE